MIPPNVNFCQEGLGGYTNHHGCAHECRAYSPLLHNFPLLLDQLLATPSGRSICSGIISAVIEVGGLCILTRLLQGRDVGTKRLVCRQRVNCIREVLAKVVTKCLIRLLPGHL